MSSPIRKSFRSGRAALIRRQSPPPTICSRCKKRCTWIIPSVYGTDNSATLDGIKQLGPERARGVAVIDEKTSAADVDAMHKGGIRGILETGVFDTAVAAK